MSRLGAGGMGVVYRVFDRARDEQVALKLLRHHDPLAILRFKSEFRSLADLVHPNLARLHELFSRGEQYYFTMELVQGTNYLRHIREEGVAADSDTMTAQPPSTPPLQISSGGQPAALPAPSGPPDLERLRDATVQLVQGVSALHAAGKLHRDIKPTNVLVTEAGRVVLLDFGLVVELDASSYDSQNRLLVGTAHYMSPEQGASLPVAPPSDWYSVGVMLYQALTGRLPFDGPPLAVLTDKQHGEPPPPRALVPDTPPRLDALCTALLSRHPSRRPGAAAILAVLEDTAAVRRPRGHLPGSDPAPVAGREPAVAAHSDVDDDDELGDDEETRVRSHPGVGGDPGHAQAGAGAGAGAGVGVVGAVFVGRQRHLSTLRGALIDARARRTAVVWIHGHSGMGKSALLDRFTREVAHTREAIVMSGRCYERESVPYKALDALVDALSQHLSREPLDRQLALLPPGAGALARLFPVLSRVEAIACRDEVEVMDPHELRRRATAALRELLARMSASSPVMLVIDDLQWGDIDSAVLLADVMRAPAPPVAVVLSHRTAATSTSEAVRLLRRELAPENDRDLRELHVGPMTHAEAVELALGRLADGSAAAQVVADAIAREAGGNPLFVDELVRYLRSEAADDADSETVIRTVSLDEAIRARVAVQPADARAVLDVVCVAGHPLPEPVAVRAADIAGDPRAALSALHASFLLRSRTHGGRDVVESYHDRTRDAVVAALPAANVAALHARLARALEDSGTAEPEALALHYHGAGDDRRAGDYAAAAADHAAGMLAFERAAVLYRMALDLLSDEEVARRSLRQQLGEALTNAGRGAEAAAELLEAADTAPDAEALELRRRAAEQLLRAGHLDEGLDAMRSVLDSVGLKLADTPRAALIAFLRRRARLRLRGTRWRERAPGEIAPETLRRIDVCWSVSTGLGAVDMIRGADFQARHVLLALAAGEPYRVARALAVEAMYLATSGPSTRDRTRALIDEARAIAERIGNPHAQGVVLVATGMTAYQAGEYRAALAAFEDADRVFCERCTGVSLEIATARRFAIDALFNLGRLGEMSRRVHDRLREAERRGDLLTAIDMRTGLPNAAWLCADDPDSAHREAQVGMTRWSRDGFHLQHYYDALARTNAALYTGDTAGAHRRVVDMWPALRRAMLLRIQIVRVEATFLLGRAAAAAAMSGDRTALATAKSAARKLEREPIPAAQPSAAVIRAAIAQARGDDEGAVALFARAGRAFDDADMALMAAVCWRQRGVIMGGDDGAEAVRAADAFMVDQHIRAPARFARLFVAPRPSEP